MTATESKIVNNSSSLRLFFALWPPAALKSRLYRCAEDISRHCRGRPTSLQNLHITLHFLGEVERFKLASLYSAVSAVKIEPFDLQLDRLVQMPRLRMLWAVPDHRPEPLLRLHSTLRDAIAAAGCQAAGPSEYRPHVTLLRKFNGNGEQLGFQPLKWQVTAFALVVSRQTAGGVEYQTLRRWPLI